MIIVTSITGYKAKDLERQDRRQSRRQSGSRGKITNIFYTKKMHVFNSLVGGGRFERV